MKFASQLSTLRSLPSDLGHEESPARLRRGAHARAALAAAFCLTLAACGAGQSYELVGSPSAPGADAQLDVEPQDANATMNLEAHNLLPPARVKESARYYAVWIKPGERPVVHLGNLAYDQGDRTGKLSATTPHRIFELTVTAESSPTPTEPSGPTVLSQSVALD